MSLYAAQRNHITTANPRRQRKNHKISYNPEMPKIPLAVIAVVSAALANSYSHADIDQFMEAAGIEMDPLPVGNRQVKARAWLKHANETMPDPLATLGRVINELMEVPTPQFRTGETINPEPAKVADVLENYGLSYVRGGYIAVSGAKAVSNTLQDIIRARDLPGLEIEFERIYDNLQSDPEAAVTAASALLESLFKSYIEEEGLELPSEQSLKPLWKVVRKNLTFDPALVEDEDLKTVLGGLAAIVEGLGSLRTHKGSAHGRGKRSYRIEPRHARLAAHAAFTVATFVMEAWKS
jgi:hypothetical protein